jgi:hypothetical protein
MGVSFQECGEGIFWEGGKNSPAGQCLASVPSRPDEENQQIDVDYLA